MKHDFIVAVMTYSWKCVFCFFAVFKEYAEFQYRRRHRQRRRGDMSSLRSNTPDPDDPSENNLGMPLVIFLVVVSALDWVTLNFH